MIKLMGIMLATFLFVGVLPVMAATTSTYMSPTHTNFSYTISGEITALAPTSLTIQPSANTWNVSPSPRTISVSGTTEVLLPGHHGAQVSDLIVGESVVAVGTHSEKGSNTKILVKESQKEISLEQHGAP